MSEEQKYPAELRMDQWELIVLAMRHIRSMTLGAESQYGVDKLGRTFLHRRVNEITDDIVSQLPEADK